MEAISTLKRRSTSTRLQGAISQKVVLLRAMMMEAISTSETSVYFYQTTGRNIPESCHFQNEHNSRFSPEQLQTLRSRHSTATRLGCNTEPFEMERHFVSVVCLRLTPQVRPRATDDRHNNHVTSQSMEGGGDSLGTGPSKATAWPCKSYYCYQRWRYELHMHEPLGYTGVVSREHDTDTDTQTFLC
jgi:hypothetical protein